MYERDRDRSPRDRRHSPDQGYRSRYRDSSPIAEEERNEGQTLYFHGLASHTSERDIKDLFAKYGTVEDVHLVLDPRTHFNRGFGFVTFNSVKEAEDALRGADGATLDGSVITVQKANRRAPRKSTPGQYMGKKPKPRYPPMYGYPYPYPPRGYDRYAPPPSRYAPYPAPTGYYGYDMYAPPYDYGVGHSHSSSYRSSHRDRERDRSRERSDRRRSESPRGDRKKSRYY